MHIVLLKCRHVQIAFLKLPSCDNQGFRRVYSNSCWSCSFEPEIIRIIQSSQKMYSNNILNFQESYDNFKCLYKKKCGNLLTAPRIHFWSNTLGKGIEPVYSPPQIWVEWYYCWSGFFIRVVLALNNPQRLICH